MDDPHLLPSRQRRIVFFFLVSFFAIKHGLHIAVHVFQINAIFGVLIGIAMAAIMIYTFKSIFDRADRSDQQAAFLDERLDERRQRLDERLRRLRDEMSEELRKLEELNARRLQEEQIEEEQKISPWYVGLNDDRSHPKDL